MLHKTGCVLNFRWGINSSSLIKLETEMYHQFKHNHNKSKTKTNECANNTQCDARSLNISVHFSTHTQKSLIFCSTGCSNKTDKRNSCVLS